MQVLDNNKIIRNNFEKVCDAVSAEQLVEIPKGFNNNILWNFAHAIATQNILLYKMSGLPLTLPEEFIESYRKGTYPPLIEDPKKTYYQIINFSETATGQLQKDLRAMKFEEYEEYTTSFGVILRSFNDALQFNNIHEGLHLGYAMAIKRALGS